MKTYKAYLDQGEGCDYTIGCGKKVISIEANSLEEAKKKLQALISEEYNYPETKLTGAVLYEVSQEISIDVLDLYLQVANEIKAKQYAEKEKEELLELDRLKQKYNK